MGKQRVLDVLFQLTLLPPDFTAPGGWVAELSGPLHSAIIGFWR
jgi:hypothetical protein